MSLPGRGASSPIIVGKRIYLTTQTPDQGLHLLALDRETGALVWDTEIARGKLHAHELHNMATPTAVSDGRHVWVLFGTGDLACVSADGHIAWQRNLVKEFGPLKTNHGYGSSPMLDGNRLFVVRMHQGADSYVMAVDAKTGKDLWKKDRSNAAREEGKDSYSSPVFHRHGGKLEVVVAGAEVLNAYNPSTGDVVWSVSGLDVAHPTVEPLPVRPRAKVWWWRWPRAFKTVVTPLALRPVGMATSPRPIRSGNPPATRRIARPR